MNPKQHLQEQAERDRIREICRGVVESEFIKRGAASSEPGDNIAPRAKQRFRKWKRCLTLITLVIPILYLIFLVADRQGVWDRLTGLDLVQAVSDRFQQSYAAGASTPVRVGDPAWEPLLAIIYRYSKATFPADKTPRVVARDVATLSAVVPETGSEWTAPSTPLSLLYKDWPTGEAIERADYRVIGTIGELQDWIQKEKERRKFLALDVFLGLFGPLLGFLIFILERRIDE
jgi:hypothetical protein